MFNAVRARAVRGISKDPGLSGKEKAFLAAAIDRMNADNRWSCFASIETLAKDAECSERTAWRAIEVADGVHVLTKRGPVPKSKRPATFLTIHPAYRLKAKERSTESPKVQKAAKDGKKQAMNEKLQGAKNGIYKVPRMATEPTAREPTFLPGVVDTTPMRESEEVKRDIRVGSEGKGQLSIESPSSTESPRARAFRLGAMYAGNIGRGLVGRAERAGGNIEEIAAEVEACISDGGDLGAALCHFWKEEW